MNLNAINAKRPLLVGFFVFITIFIISVALLFPAVSHAQFLNPFDGHLVPCGVTDDGTKKCNFCHLLDLAKNIMDFLVMMATVVAVLMFAWAGFLYVTAGSNSGQISKAHGVFKAVFVGFIIVLLAWTIIDTIMAAFLDKKEFGPWNPVSCVIEDVDIPGVANTGGLGGGDYIPPPTPTGEPEGVIEATEYSHEDSVGILAANGMVGGQPRATGNCFEDRSGCTYLGGMNQATINEVASIFDACNRTLTGFDTCNYVVTGGTEPGHSTRSVFSHRNGYKIDISRNNPDTNGNMDNFLQNEFGRNAQDFREFTVSGYPAYSFFKSDGTKIQVLNEGNHWDIQVITPSQANDPSSGI